MNKYTDVFHEEIIVRKNRGMYNALYIFMTIFMYIAGVLAIFSLQGILQSLGNMRLLINALVSFLGFAIVTVGLFLYRDTMKLDYEYSYTNGVLDIAQVKNNKKRKELLSCDIKEIELVAPIMTNEFNRYQSMNDIKKINAWLNRDMKKYFAIIRKGGEKNMLIFEPSDKFISTLKKYSPSKVKTQ